MWWIMDLAERMKGLRLRAGMSQEALARQLNKTQVWVSRRELGVTAFKPDDIEEWAEACGCRVDQVILPLNAPAEDLIRALSNLDPQEAQVLAEVARCLPVIPPAVREHVLAQLQLTAGRFPVDPTDTSD